MSYGVLFIGYCPMCGLKFRNIEHQEAHKKMCG